VRGYTVPHCALNSSFQAATLDRYWLLTSTTYGTWLPGDERGFVSEKRDTNGAKILHNAPGTPFDSDEPLLAGYAELKLKGPPIMLSVDQAKALLEQFKETATHRRWLLLAVAIMTNHFHIVVGVEGDPDPSRILGDFKSYGSRKLNRGWGRPESDTWWTESGSKRKLESEANVLAAVRYVEEQEYPLVIWVAEQYLRETRAQRKK
jgi:REP element-mobilizing transposase RayT